MKNEKSFEHLSSKLNKRKTNSRCYTEQTEAAIKGEISDSR